MNQYSILKNPILFILMITFLPWSVFCATITWTNGNSTGIWSDPLNWSPNQVPTGGDDVVFDGTSTDNCTLDLDNQSVLSLTMTAAYTGTFSLSFNGYRFEIFSSLTTAGGFLDTGNSTVVITGIFTCNCPFQPFAHLEIDMANAAFDATFNGDPNLLNLILTEVDQINGGKINLAGDLIATDALVSGTSVISFNGIGAEVNGAGGGKYPSIIAEFTADITFMTSDTFNTVTIAGGTGDLNNQVVSTENGFTVGNSFFVKSLIGNGTIGGNLLIDGNGSSTSISPGLSPGCITVDGNLTFSASAESEEYVVEINGATPCTQHDQLSVSGDLTLGANARITGTSSATPDSTIIIIDNAGPNPVSGAFHDVAGSPIPEGGTVTLSSVDYTISYVGGDGNDVTLSPPDTDDDGIFDTVDNCPNDPNPAQGDIDNDGIGNPCDDDITVGEKMRVEDNLFLDKLYSGVIVKSDDGSCWMLTVSNLGEVEATKVNCP